MLGTATAGSLGRRPLGRLTALCRDGALVLIGVGILDWLVLVAALSWARENWWSMPVAAVLFSLAYLFLVDSEGRSLIKKVELRSETVGSEISVEPHHALRLTAIRGLLLMTVFTVALVLVTSRLGIVSLTALWPAQLIAAGMLSWARGDRVRGWERLHESQVFVSVSGHLRLKVRYFVRPLAD